MELELAERSIYSRALAQGNTTLGSQDPSHDVWPIWGLSRSFIYPEEKRNCCNPEGNENQSVNYCQCSKSPSSYIIPVSPIRFFLHVSTK
jgi:hypothetical protein